MPKFSPTTNNTTGEVSTKKTMIWYTWVWSILVATAFIVRFLIEPSQLVSGALTSISMLLGTILTIAYTGYIVGEYSKNKVLGDKLPPVQIPK
jgi:hypothetical protein